MTLLPLLPLLLLSNPDPAKPTICIDPGHPSEIGMGTKGKRVSEVHIAWSVAKRLEEKLEKLGLRVVMTKQREDQFVKNVDRSKIANEAKANLFVRLHCDAASGSGFATYYPDRQGTADGITGPSPDLLRAIAPMAKRFHAAMGKQLAGHLADNGLKPDTMTKVGKERGALIGSIHSRVPVVLVEMCVLTNPADEAFIASKDGQDRMAEALKAGVLGALIPID